jgi:formylmethanofuran dehydrogenase subunit E
MANGTPDLDQHFRRLLAHHEHLCPRQVLGVRMGIRAAGILGLDLPADSTRTGAVVETDGCFADAVSVATGCWLGKRNLRLADYGKVAVTLVDTSNLRGVRVYPHPLARLRAQAYAPAAATRWHAQLEGYQRMPTHQLLCHESVRLVGLLAERFAEPVQRVVCTACGEEVVNRGLDARVGTQDLCLACATSAYYELEVEPRSALAA